MAELYLLLLAHESAKQVLAFPGAVRQVSVRAVERWCEPVKVVAAAPDADAPHAAPLQALVWAGVSALSVLIVASRKHYTVDVVIAWYVVPLVFHALARRWSTKRHATEGTLLGDVVYAADVDAGGAQLKVWPFSQEPVLLC